MPASRLASIAKKSRRADKQGAGRAPLSEVPLPTFLIIGAQKSGTRWLRSNLALHPEVYAAPKELWFFNNVQKRFHEGGLEWYREQFDGWQGEPIVGEATPGYMMPRHEPEVVAKRIGRVVPDVRLIAILRNPIDRAQSAMIHQIKRHRLPADARLIDIARQTTSEDDRFDLIAAGRYSEVLQPYVKRFGDQLLVLLHDDISADAARVYRDALVHIGASDDFLPAELAKVRYSNRDRVAEDQRDLPTEERLALYDCYRGEVVKLEQLLGIDLSRWNPELQPESTAREDGSSRPA